MSGQRASIHVLFRCSKRERAMKNHQITVSGSPPKAEATGSNPVGCARNQQLSEHNEAGDSPASELCSSHARETLLALADRVEALTGPCRETDAAIAVAALGYFELPPRWEGGPIGYGYMDDEGCRVEPGHGGDQLIRKFTASIDAAMTLVPEGHLMMVVNAGTKEVRPVMGISAAMVGRHDDVSNINPVEAANPTLALTAAALRARAESLPC